MAILDLLKGLGIDDLGDVAKAASTLLGSKTDTKSLVKSAKTKKEKTQLLDIIGSMLSQDSKSGNIDILKLAMEFLGSKNNDVLKKAISIISKLGKDFPEVVATMIPQLTKIASGNSDPEIRKSSALIIESNMKHLKTKDKTVKTKIATAAKKTDDLDVQDILSAIIDMFD
jgi:hypothetical protein